MRTKSLAMLVVAVAALTVMSGRAAWAQTPCTTNADCPDDGIFCNGTESCDTGIGQCVSSGDPCVSGVECNNGPCDETTHCLTPAGMACTSDSNPCTDDQCDGNGTCAHQNNTNACDDGNACTTNDTCAGGTCTGTPVLNGTVCDDGNFCTASDACQNGTCVG